MKKLMVCILLMAVVATACHDRMEDPADAAKQVLKTALVALNANDIDTYMQSVDFATDMDSVQESCLRAVLAQHLVCQQEEFSDVKSIDIIDANMEGDTVCTLYYQYTFSDTLSCVMSQKMVRKGEEWKLRLRN